MTDAPIADTEDSVEYGWEPAELTWLPADDAASPRLLRATPFREAVSRPGARNTFSLPKNANYLGPLAVKRPEEVAYMLAEAIEYFGLQFQPIPPVPYDGLYGQRELRRDGLVEEVWGEAMQLLHSIASGKPRAVEKAWLNMRAIMRGLGDDAVHAHMVQEALKKENADRARESATQVYFIGGQSGTVKIGMAADPKKRLASLQTGHHERLSILATCQGGRDQERAYHERFADHRITGEWFSRHPDILAEITRLQGTPSHD